MHKATKFRATLQLDTVLLSKVCVYKLQSLGQTHMWNGSHQFKMSDTQARYICTEY